jgi:2-alkyl-3-oxoalkanoate reductase
MVRTRRLPIAGSGEGLWSFIHIDEPQPRQGSWSSVTNGCRSWRRVLGAKPPMRVPAWLVKPFVGEYIVNAMTANRGSSNAKAKRDLGWELAHPSWRMGFRDFA